MGVYEYFFGTPDDEGENEGLIYRLGWKIIQLSIIFWAVVIIFDGEMTYIYGYNMFLWMGVLGLLLLIALVAYTEEEKDPDELEKEKTDQTLDYSKYNKKMDEDYSEYNKKMDEEPPLP